VGTLILAFILFGGGLPLIAWTILGFMAGFPARWIYRWWRARPRPAKQQQPTPDRPGTQTADLESLPDWMICAQFMPRWAELNVAEQEAAARARRTYLRRRKQWRMSLLYALGTVLGVVILLKSGEKVQSWVMAIAWFILAASWSWRMQDAIEPKR
jgi:hypothetical protein